MLTYKRNSHL